MHSDPFTEIATTLSIAIVETVNCVVFEVMPFKLAVIFDAPEASDAASPLEPDVLLIVATSVFEELQVTEVVISCVVLSE